MAKLIPSALFTALGLALSLTLPAASVSVTTRPAEITVYPQGAKVVRRGQAGLSAGPVTVLFDGLPASADEASIRLGVDGPKGTKLEGVRFSRSFSPAETVARRAEMERKIEALNDQKAALADGIASRQDEIDMLKGLAAHNTSQMTAAGAKPADISQLPAALDKVARRLAELMAANRKDTRQVKLLDDKIAALNSEMNQGGSGSRQTRAAEADLDLPEAGTVSFELSYDVAQAGWTPVYDLRLSNGAAPKVSLAFNADITQQSGEDWNEAKLELCTARLGAASQVPEPRDWWLDFFVPRPYAAMAPAPESALGNSISRKKLAQNNGETEDEESAPAEVQYAQTQTAEFSTSFAVRRTMTVASDGTQHRVAIAEASYPTEVGLVAVPRLAKAAFIQARVRYDAKEPLLPGLAFLFNDDRFVGKTSLASVAGGDLLKIGFGQDDKVKVTRELRAEKTGDSLFGVDRHQSYHWVTSLQNFHEGERSVEVREQVPRSRQKDISVETLRLDPKPEPADENQPGLLRWKVSLKPQEERKINFEYQVRYPADKQITGLE